MLFPHLIHHPQDLADLPDSSDAPLEVLFELPQFDLAVSNHILIDAALSFDLVERILFLITDRSRHIRDRSAAVRGPHGTTVLQCGGRGWTGPFPGRRVGIGRDGDAVREQ